MSHVISNIPSTKPLGSEKKNKYDMTDNVVYTTLHNMSDGVGSICIECDCNLCTTYVCT